MPRLTIHRISRELTVCATQVRLFLLLLLLKHTDCKYFWRLILPDEFCAPHNMNRGISFTLNSRNALNTRQKTVLEVSGQ